MESFTSRPSGPLFTAKWRRERREQVLRPPDDEPAFGKTKSLGSIQLADLCSFASLGSRKKGAKGMREQMKTRPARFMGHFLFSMVR